MPETLIHLKDIRKYYRELNRQSGFWGSVRDLFSQDYRTIKAVDGVDLDIQKGEIVGFLGPNGAGKSTTIKMMTGVLQPTSGHIVIDGHVPFKDRVRYVQKIGVVFGQRTQLWWELPVLESFKLMKEIFRIPQKTFDFNLARFEELVHLDELYGQQVRNLSLGQRMLCDIAASFLHDPSIIFLDEPTIGLDVVVKSQIRKLILALNQEKKTTILLTTHDIGDVEALCRRLVLIDKGKNIYDGAIEHFNRMFGSWRTVRLLGKEGQRETLVRGLENVESRFEGVKLSVSANPADWVSLVVDDEKVAVKDVLGWALETLPVKDVKIDEIETEEVISRVYAGALK